MPGFVFLKSNTTHLDLVEVVLEQSVDGFLELGRKVEAVLLEPGSPLQPELDALAQRRLTFRGHQLLRRVGNVLEDSVVVLLVVLDAVFLKSKHDMNDNIDKFKHNDCCYCKLYNQLQSIRLTGLIPSLFSSSRNCRLWKPEALERCSLKSMKLSGVIVSRMCTWSTKI